MNEYKVYIKKYDTELSDTCKKIDKLYAEKQVTDSLDQKYKEWVNMFSDYINITELTRTVVIELIKRIDVYEDGSIKIHYRFKNPYESSK